MNFYFNLALRQHSLFMKYLITVACLFFYQLRVNAATYVFDYNSRCAEAYRHYMSLELEEGTALVKQELMANPYNLMATYLADYEDCLLLLFNGSKTDYEQRKDHMRQRIELLEKSNEAQPWLRLCKAGMYMRWAVIHTRFDEKLKAAAMFRKAYLLLKENKRLFPGFDYNDVLYGVAEAVSGTIPDEYKWFASILGLKGSVKAGVNKVWRFVGEHDMQDMFYMEAQLYASYLRFYLLSDQDQVWRYINSTRFVTDNNLLYLFVKANIGLNYRHADAALQAMQAAQKLPAYNRFPIMDYETGGALLMHLDTDCTQYYKRFLSRYQGGLFVKDALMRMSLSYLLQGNTAQANKYREQILAKGSTTTDADKQAMRFAKSNVWPDKTLLQSRLLIDGGQYKTALALLSKYKSGDFSNIADQVEYFFRLGRAYDELNETSIAVRHYRTAIDMGRERPEYFAARAALQLGFLYEDKGDAPKARYWYTESMNMQNEDFKSSIDQQAKAGINRLSSK